MKLAVSPNFRTARLCICESISSNSHRPPSPRFGFAAVVNFIHRPWQRPLSSRSIHVQIRSCIEDAEWACWWSQNSFHDGRILARVADCFRHAKIAAMTPRVRLRPSSNSFPIGASPQGFSAKEENYSLLLLLPQIPKQLDRIRPMPSATHPELGPHRRLGRACQAAPHSIRSVPRLEIAGGLHLMATVLNGCTREEPLAGMPPSKPHLPIVKSQGSRNAAAHLSTGSSSGLP